VVQRSRSRPQPVRRTDSATHTPLNAHEDIEEFPELEDALESDAVESDSSSDSDPDAVQSAGAEDDDLGPELSAFLKGL
jgi:hypothetical protein